MVTVSCDVCKKKIDDTADGRTFFRVAYHSICEPCRDALEALVRPAIRSHEPYTFEWYESFVIDTLDKACQKGKI